MSHNSDKVGHLESLQLQSDDELHILLKRQLALLKNKKVIQRLPDKGEKIQDLADKISRELELRKRHVDDTVRGITGLTITKNGDELSSTLGEIINTGQREKVFINTYERVMFRHQQDPADLFRPANRFHPNRNTKESSGESDKSDVSRSNISPAARSNSSTFLSNCSSANKIQSAVDTNHLSDVSTGSANDDNENFSQSAQPVGSNGVPISSDSIPGSSEHVSQNTQVTQRTAEKNPIRYEGSLLDLRTPCFRTKVIDFEESFSLLNQQFTSSHAQAAQPFSIPRIDSMAQTIKEDSRQLESMQRYRDTVEVADDILDSDDNVEEEDD